MDIVEFNKRAWNWQVENKNVWTIPVTSEHIKKARNGCWSVVLTPQKPVPKDWFPEMKGLDVLALASGGGQQGPVFAAAGANVTVFDLSPKQLAQDKMVAERDGLQITTVEGDMKNLSCFKDESFDFIFHPCSNVFVPDVNPVWGEAYRVLRKGGTLIAGFCNPLLFTFDIELEKQGIVQMKYKIPYSDATSITAEERLRFFGPHEPINYGHTLNDQIGGQLKAGFSLIGFYEDRWDNSAPINNYIDCFIATRARK